MAFSAITTFSAILNGIGDSNLNPIGTCGLYTLQPMFEWSMLKFDTQRSFTPHATYQPNCTYITSIDEAGGLLYLSTPRDFDILPASLSTIPASVSVARTSSPNLKPYPDMNWHRMPANASECNTTLVSVRGTDKDGCNRLWVLDSGILFDGDNTYQKICPPKIVIFNLFTNKPDKVLVLPDEVLKPLSVLCNIVVDPVILPTVDLTSNVLGCDNAFAYIADADMSALIVYSPRHQFYRITSPNMSPDPKYATFEISGETFDCLFGIYGLDVGGTAPGRFLYFQPVSGVKLYSIPTSFLQAGPFNGDPSRIPVAERLVKASGGLALRTDTANGCILFNTITQNCINAWNPTQGVQRTVVPNSTYLSAVYDIATDSKNILQKYVLTVNLPRYVNGNVDIKAKNMRIMSLTNTP